MKKLGMLMATIAIGLVPCGVAKASLTNAQAQTEFNKAQHDLADDGWKWFDGGGPHPLISRARVGGWVADGDYIHRCAISCAIQSQICWLHAWLSPSGYWIELTKTRCR